MVYWIPVNMVSLGEGHGATVCILNSILFAYGAEENVEMHGIYFWHVVEIRTAVLNVTSGNVHALHLHEYYCP